MRSIHFDFKLKSRIRCLFGFISWDDGIFPPQNQKYPNALLESKES
ncbi:hypothetical protein JWG40_03685 [Leptospira sp. 201903074]|nr:hypothetical protein [Leptospira abararensis]MBM9546102.1 hypothetical protein [Leptospira abararensis]